MRDFALLDAFILILEGLMKLPTVKRLHMKGNRWCSADVVSFCVFQMEMFLLSLQRARKPICYICVVTILNVIGILRYPKILLPPCSGRFRENIFETGEIGGRCKFDEILHKQQGEHKSPLQSW